MSSKGPMHYCYYYMSIYIYIYVCMYVCMYVCICGVRMLGSPLLLEPLKV